jgi:ornithine cyclodeaminase
LTDSAIATMSAVEIFAALPFPAAVAALERALVDGFDPADDPPRSVLDVPAGQFLLMPSAVGDACGVKVATVAPDNPRVGRPRVSATYLLYDAATLGLRAMLDGTALTSLRTPAVSVAAIRPALERYAPPPDVVVFGAGPQARGHVAALRECVPSGLGEVHHVVRDPGSVAAGIGDEILPVGDSALRPLLRTASIIVCATTSRTPLFDSALLADDATVIAVGSHEADAREVDAGFLSRAQVVVEDIATALREAGDVIMAVAEGAITAESLIPMAAVVRNAATLDLSRPVLFKSSGMSWEDLVVAHAVLAR